MINITKDEIDVHIEIATQILRQMLVENVTDEGAYQQLHGHISLISKYFKEIGLSEKELGYILVHRIRDVLMLGFSCA